MFNRILLSVDGSENLDRAVRATMDLARIHDAEVLVVHGRKPAPVVAPILTSDVADDEAALRVAAAVSELRSCAVRARGKLLPRGALGPEIVKAARSTRADLIVVGSRGLAAREELDDGARSSTGIPSADRPMLLVC